MTSLAYFNLYRVVIYVGLPVDASYIIFRLSLSIYCCCLLLFQLKGRNLRHTPSLGQYFSIFFVYYYFNATETLLSVRMHFCCLIAILRGCIKCDNATCVKHHLFSLYTVSYAQFNLLLFYINAQFATFVHIGLICNKILIKYGAEEFIFKNQSL